MKSRFVRTFITVFIITLIIMSITTVKMYAKERNVPNVLPAVDILVIEADTTQGYN